VPYLGVKNLSVFLSYKENVFLCKETSINKKIYKTIGKEQYVVYEELLLLMEILNGEKSKKMIFFDQKVCTN